MTSDKASEGTGMHFERCRCSCCWRPPCLSVPKGLALLFYKGICTLQSDCSCPTESSSVQQSFLALKFFIHVLAPCLQFVSLHSFFLVEVDLLSLFHFLMLLTLQCFYTAKHLSHGSRCFYDFRCVSGLLVLFKLLLTIIT